MLESFTTDKFEYKRLSNEEQKTRGILGRLVGIIGDTKNATRNGRRYNKDLWQKVFDDPIVNEKIENRLMLGEMGHPEDREEIDLEKVAICLAEKPKVGKDGSLWGVFDIIDTPNGRLLKALCDYGCNIGISSRGTGDIIYDENGDEMVDPDTYVLETYDAVIVPGVEKARLQYVNESLDTKKRNKTLRQKLTEEVNKASEEDKKIMKETLKNLNIKLNEDTKTINEKLVKPSEEDINEIKNDLANIGFRVDREGETWFGNKHLQLILDGDNHNAEELRSVADQLHEITDKWEDKNIPITFNVGLTDKYEITCGLDIRDKYIPDEIGEELEQEDGWGDFISDESEYLFNELESLMYEIRNCRRGSYAGFGNTVPDLVDELNRLSSSLSDLASRINYNETELTEKCGKKDAKLKEDLPNRKSIILKLNDDEDYKDQIKDFLEKEYATSIDDFMYEVGKDDNIDVWDIEWLNESIDDDSSDKEVDSNDNTAVDDRDEFIDQLKEALTRGSQLEKDNLSLQEQLSVCNAKEIKLKNELIKYKKAVSTLSESVKDHHSLNEALDESIKLNKDKDRLLKSNEKVLKVYRTRLKEARESKDSNKTIVENLNSNVKTLNEKLSSKEDELLKTTRVIKKLKSALKEAKEAYVTAQAAAYGLSEANVRSRLKESFSLKEVDSVCESLLEHKLNMGKLPFRLNENTQISFKPSTNEYIHGCNYLDDDVVSNNLLNMLD